MSQLSIDHKVDVIGDTLRLLNKYQKQLKALQMKNLDFSFDIDAACDELSKLQ